jgi:hypothetical protein
MCLSVLAIEPGGEWPVRLLSFREEFLERSWEPAAPWWEQHPEVVAGRDQQAGGTWLAVAPARRRVAAIHTSFTARVPAERRRTRGEIPIAAAAAARWDDRLSCYDDFTLLVVDDTGATWHGYRDGVLASQSIGPGIHLGSVAGLGPTTDRPRQRHWTEVIAREGLPKLDEAGSPATGWQRWLERTGAAAMAPTDELALLIRRQPRDRVFGTSSVSFVAFPPTGRATFHVLADAFGQADWTSAEHPQL